MAEGRKVTGEEAGRLLAEWERSGERMSSWCAARGLNWYSLSAFKGWQERASAPAMLHLAEVVVRQAPQPATYRVLLGNAAIEVDDDFRADTLRRLVQVVASC